MGGASSRASGRGRGARVGFRPPPAATARTRIRSAASPQMLPGAGRAAGRGPGGEGSPFWPPSAAYQERERKAHRQRSSSVRKVPLRSLISSGARRAPAGPRPHGPGGPGRGAGPGGGGDGGPGPGAGRGGARGRAGLGSAPPGLWARVAGTGPRSAAGPGRTGLGWAARAAARPGSGATAESAARGGAGRPGFKGAAAPAVAASTTRRRGGDQLPPWESGPRVGSRVRGCGPPWVRLQVGRGGDLRECGSAAVQAARPGPPIPFLSFFFLQSLFSE